MLSKIYISKIRYAVQFERKFLRSRVNERRIHTSTSKGRKLRAPNRNILDFRKQIFSPPASRARVARRAGKYLCPCSPLPGRAFFSLVTHPDNFALAYWQSEGKLASSYALIKGVATLTRSFAERKGEKERRRRRRLS